MKKLLTIFVLILPLNLQAAVAVIVHPDNDVDISLSEIRSIFLAKSTFYPDGSEPIVYQLNADDASSAVFNKKALKKSNSSLNSYWARMLFSSQGKPPKELTSSLDMKRIVAQNKSAIGYIDASEVDSSVRVLFELE